MAATAGSTAAAAAAAAEQQRLQEEEEEMTTYTPEELTEDWEFKIVRANTPIFRKPEVLQRLIEEEAQAGWVMVEKFDNMRVRFKRPRSARTGDAMLPEGVDPYRTTYGMGQEQTLVALGVILGAIFLLGLGVLLFLVFAAR